MTEQESHFPITPTDTMFIELNVEMNKAMAAGFTRKEAFGLINTLFATRGLMMVMESVTEIEGGRGENSSD